jgi:hypothetical protein
MRRHSQISSPSSRHPSGPTQRSLHPPLPTTLPIHVPACSRACRLPRGREYVGQGDRRARLGVMHGTGLGTAVVWDIVLAQLQHACAAAGGRNGVSALRRCAGVGTLRDCRRVRDRSGGEDPCVPSLLSFVFLPIYRLDRFTHSDERSQLCAASAPAGCAAGASPHPRAARNRQPRRRVRVRRERAEHGRRCHTRTYQRALALGAGKTCADLDEYLMVRRARLLYCPSGAEVRCNARRTTAGRGVRVALRQRLVLRRLVRRN